MDHESRNTLSKSERLSSESRMDTLFGEGRKGSAGPLKFCWLAVAGDGEAGVSVLFSVPKKAFKRAWKRNLIKRRMRESYRQRKHSLTTRAREAGLNIDIALICLPAGAKEARKATAPLEIPDFKTIDNAIATILEKILDRC